MDAIRRVIGTTYWIWDNLGTIALIESPTEDGVIIVDVRDLSDVESDVNKVKNKIIVVASLLCLGFKVAVRCYGGMNRSNAIAISSMCYMRPEGDIRESWNFHRSWTKRKVGRVHITPELEITCKKALAILLKDFKGYDDSSYKPDGKK